MFLITPLLLIAVIALASYAWHRLLDPLPKTVVLLLGAIVCVYQAETLFTPAVDLPGNLAFHAFPWKALNRPAANANTGIIFTEIAPWTAEARRQLLGGELPLWNRTLGAGSPLLANQQTAIFHAFTLIGLVLPIGDAWTLSIGLRLFFSLLPMYVFLRRWQVHPAAAVFGAVVYSFCTFHVVWLLFPLGLATMTMPLALVAADGVVRHGRLRDFLLLVFALSLAVLGGHPESALFVGVTAAAYVAYLLTSERLPMRARIQRLLFSGAAAIAAMMLTSPVWLTGLKYLQQSERYETARALQQNVNDHQIGSDWMLPLIAPNIHGTPQTRTYQPPQPRHADLLDDYGEIASGYAGILTIALAGVALASGVGRPRSFFIGTAIVSFLTIYETPGWYFVVRKLPLFGLALHPRLRIVWVLSVVVLSALALSRFIEGSLSRGDVRRAVFLCGAALAAVYFFSLKQIVAREVADVQAIFAGAAFLVLLVSAWAVNRLPSHRFAYVATAAAFLELVAVTFRYNPPSLPADVYPVTPAIRLMATRETDRMAAYGWSFIPNTPGFYRLEDIKTTDTMQGRRYKVLLQKNLKLDPSDYNQTLGDLTSPFLDFLNVRFLYVPADHEVKDAALSEVYRGADGSVLLNREALPRYFIPAAFEIDGSYDSVAEKTLLIRDFRGAAFVDHIPARIEKMGARFRRGVSAEVGRQLENSGGVVELQSYKANETVLRVKSGGWNLLVSSDSHSPGWRAYWNGERIPPVVVNGAFVGCFVPPGDGVLRLRYFPAELDDALRISGAALILLLIGATAVVIRRRRVMRAT